MNAVLTLYRSTVGKKVVMAVTGAIMAGWLTVHMGGNLQVFLGSEVYNHYAELIQSQIEILWLMRAFLLATIGLHIWSVVSLIMTSSAARKTGYQGPKKRKAATLASTLMAVGGGVLLLFIVFHLLDLTVGVPAIHAGFQRGDAYGNLVRSLSRPAVAIFYILANLALGMHLYHGVYSVFQTLGINQIGDRDNARMAGTALAVLVAGGNIVIALSILIGLVGA